MGGLKKNSEFSLQKDQYNVTYYEGCFKNVIYEVMAIKKSKEQYTTSRSRISKQY